MGESLRIGIIGVGTISKAYLDILSAAPGVEVVAAVQGLRGQDLLKPPGVAETLDWTDALVALGADHLDADRAAATLGSVLKFREDQQRALALGFGDTSTHSASSG
jgi:MoxR-like ATPase